MSQEGSRREVSQERGGPDAKGLFCQAEELGLGLGAMEGAQEGTWGPDKCLLNPGESGTEAAAWGRRRCEVVLGGSALDPKAFCCLRKEAFQPPPHPAEAPSPIASPLLPLPSKC